MSNKIKEIKEAVELINDAIENEGFYAKIDDMGLVKLTLILEK